MKRNKRSVVVLFCIAVLFALSSGINAVLPFISPIMASAESAESGKTASAGYAFLDNGNAPSMRKRIASNYSSCFVEFYDKMQEELTDATLNNKDTVDSFTVHFDFGRNKYKVSEDPEANDDISFQLLRFAQNVLESSPQFYWTNSENKVKMIYYYTNSYYTAIDFEFLIDSAFRTYEKRAAANRAIDSAIESYRSVVDAQKDTAGKLRAVNDKLVIDTYYDISDSGSGKSPNSQNAYGCLINKLCVCNGYAKGFQLICRTLDIADTVRVSGSLYNKSSKKYISHAWNACDLGGRWYFIDVTANDPLKDTHGKNEYNQPERYSTCFLLGRQKLSEDHKTEENAVPYPVFEEYDYVEPGLNTVTIDGEEYFVISDAQELRKFASLAERYTASPNAILTSDIDLGGEAFTPVCAAKTYNGIFDGSGHTIKGLNADTDKSPAGLFGFADKAEIKDLTLSNGTVNGSVSDASKGCGAFAGSITSDTVIKGCINKSVKVTGACAGGIAGCITRKGREVTSGSITECKADSEVTAYSCGGGIVGSAEADNAVLIEDSVTLGSVSAPAKGAFVGKAGSYVTVKDSLSAVPCDAYGAVGKEGAAADKVFLTAYDSRLQGVYKVENTADGFIAYELGWGQRLGIDVLPSPYLKDEDSQVYLFEYVTDNSAVKKYFNGRFTADLFPEEDLPEGHAWIYNDKQATADSLEGLSCDIRITAEKMDVYVSDLASMSIGESMAYNCLVGAEEEIIESFENDDGSPVVFNAVAEGGMPVRFSIDGVKTVDGRKYLQYSVELPVKDLSEEFSCAVTFERNGKRFTLTAEERSAADYLTKLAADDEQPEAVREAAVKILNYSAAVQTYKGHNTDSLSNERLTSQQKETQAVKKADIAAEAPVFTQGSSEITLKAVTVDMLSKINLRAYYKLSGEALAAYENDKLRFDYTMPYGKKGSVMVGKGAENSGICGSAGAYIWVELPEGISPVDYGEFAEITLSTDAVTGDSIKYSVLGYIAEKCETENGMEEVAAALYRYYEAINELT